MKHHTTFIFRKKNYLIMGVGLVIIVLGFILMSGGESSTPNIFDTSVFTFRRIHLAPTLVLLGFAIEIYAILAKPTQIKENEK
nr:DUF3098 domain-containing protein [uncultured Capnocytophaga sp.]